MKVLCNSKGKVHEFKKIKPFRIKFDESQLFITNWKMNCSQTILGHTEDAATATLNHFYIMSAHIIPAPEDREHGVTFIFLFIVKGVFLINPLLLTLLNVPGVTIRK